MKKAIAAIIMAIALMAALMLPSLASPSNLSKGAVLSSAARQQLKQADAMKTQLISQGTRAALAPVTTWAELDAAVADPNVPVIMIANNIQMEDTLILDRSMVIMSISGGDVTLFSAADQMHFMIESDYDVYLVFESIILDGGGISQGLLPVNLSVVNCVTTGNLEFYYYEPWGDDAPRSVFISNAVIQGSINASAYGQITLYNCEVTGGNNNGTYSGINLHSNDDTALYNCEILGGYVNVNGIDVTISNTTYSNGIGNGFQIFAANSDITGSDFVDSEVGVMVSSSYATLTDCNFIGNDRSGVLFYTYQATLTNCIISGNVSNNSGGGLFINKYWEIDQCLVTFQGCTIIDNYADEYGGGIAVVEDYPAFSLGPAVVILEDDCLVSGNQALYGAGISNANGEVIIDGSTVELNGCYYDNSYNMVVTADKGGGIYADTLTAQSGSNITDNYANLDGGGIYCLGNVTINRSNVDYNIAGGNGGGIWTSGVFTLNNTSNVRSNDAGGNGGGVYILGTPYVIANQARITRNFPDQVYFGP